MQLILIVGGFLLLVLIGVGAYMTMRGEKSLVEERIDTYLEDSKYDPGEFGASEPEEEETTSAIADWITNMASGSDRGSRIADKLARADLKLKVGEYILVWLISTAFFGFVGYYVLGHADGLTGMLFGLLGFVAGGFVPSLYVKQQETKRLRRFNEQLSDMLNLMVNGLRAGFSTMQALEAVSKELPPPISGEFRRVVQEMQLGISMEVAFDNLLARIPSEDLDLCITAINVQREVGGNLAEVLETISHTIRERVRIKGEIKTLTSQVVYSGRFLSMLPVIVSFLLMALNPDYMGQFFDEPKACGIALLVCGGIMIMIGYAVMNKIADIEV